MKVLKQITTLFLLLCMLFALCPAVFAQDAQTEYDDSWFEGLSWEETLDRFIEERGIKPENVGIGYRNLVTGEEHFINPDQYFDAASMYKIPINMLFTSMITDGKLDWETNVGGYRYAYCIQATIIDSNNDIARGMWTYIGGYRTYRERIAPLMGEDPETAPAKYYENNFFTAREEIHCLNELYTNNERYPQVIDYLLKAEPQKYFRLHSHDVDIAHKYGYNSEVGHSYLNDSGIVFTEDPFALVMFTDNVHEPGNVLADYCDLMIAYTDYHRAERLRLEQEAAEAAAIAEIEAKTQAPSQDVAVSAPAEVSSAESAEAPASEITVKPAVNKTAAVSGNTDNGKKTAAGYIFTAIFFVLAMIYLIVRSMRSRINFFWAAGAVITAALAMAVCVYAVNTTPTVKDAEGNPAESVEAFFSALEAGNYEEAYGYVSGYSTLGIENEPSGDAAKLVYGLLRDSCSHKLYGECSKSGTAATQGILFTALDLNLLKSDLQLRTELEVEKLVEELPLDEIYGEDDAYLDSFLDTCYVNALNDLLSAPDKYQKTSGLVIKLEYKDEMWKIVPDAELYSALSGNTSY